MIPVDMGLRRGLGVVVSGIGLLLLANCFLLMGLLIGNVASGGSGGFVVAALASIVAGMVLVLVGTAILFERPALPRA